MSQDKGTVVLQTPQRILQAARQLFVEHGFSGTSMGKIAKLADVNHSLLFHHFKNKANLWMRVKQAILQDEAALSKILPTESLDFPDFLRKLFEQGICFYQNNPDIIRIINWQRLESSAHDQIGMTLSDEFLNWLRVFKDYQQKQVIKADLSLEFLVTMIVSLISSASLDNYVFVKENHKLQAYIDFCCTMILNTVRS